MNRSLGGRAPGDVLVLQVDQSKERRALKKQRKDWFAAGLGSIDLAADPAGFLSSGGHDHEHGGACVESVFHH